MAQAPLNKYGNRRLGGRNSVSISADMSPLFDYLDGLVGAMEDATVPAAAAGAKVIYDQVKINVAGMGTVTGNLQSAVYRVLSKDNSSPGNTVYHISWNHIKAPHGHLLEFGYLRRYKVVKDKNGQFKTAIRPGKAGTPKPGRRSTRSAKDAYYIPLAEPVYVPGRAFLTSAISAQDRALEAAEKVLLEHLAGAGYYGA